MKQKWNLVKNRKWNRVKNRKWNRELDLKRYVESGNGNRNVQMVLRGDPYPCDCSLLYSAVQFEVLSCVVAVPLSALLATDVLLHRVCVSVRVDVCVCVLMSVCVCWCLLDVRLLCLIPSSLSPWHDPYFICEQLPVLGYPLYCFYSIIIPLHFTSTFTG